MHHKLFFFTIANYALSSIHDTVNNNKPVMRSFSKNTVSLAILLLAFSCQKEPIINRNASSSNISNESAGNCAKNWLGLYASELNGNDTIKQKYFIHDGFVQLPAINWSNYHTRISYEIPSCHTVYGDNVIFEARVKNPIGGTVSL